MKVALLTGAGDYYSSGNDLSNFSQLMHPLTMAAQSRRKCATFVDAFISCEKPLVVAVNGPAIGIAVTTLGLCDHVIASSAATFRTPFAELAQSPEGCSSFMFPRLMGEANARALLWGGASLSAEQALAKGLVHQTESPAALMSAALSYCKALAALPAGSERLARRIVREGLVQELRRVNEEECAVLERKWVSRECFAALAAYLWSRKMYPAALLLRYSSARAAARSYRAGAGSPTPRARSGGSRKGRRRARGRTGQG